MNKPFLTLMLLMGSYRSFAVESVSIGAKMDTRPGLSINIAESSTVAFHVAASIEPGQQAQIDLEKFIYMLQFASAKLLSTTFYVKPYYGFGIRGETRKDQMLHEAVSAKGTIGTEFVSYNSPIQLFMDASPLMGPVPNLKFSGLARIGIRTQF